MKSQLALSLIIAGLVILFLLFGAYMEAKTYNRITGANVTAWEALWVEVEWRIDEAMACARGEKV